MDDYALKVAAWLEKRVRQAEEVDPALDGLKQRVRDTTAAVAAAQGDDVAPAIREQDKAIWALINHRGVKPS